MVQNSTNAEAELLLDRLLATGSDSSTRSLAELLVDHQLSSPLQRLIDAERSATSAYQLLVSWQRSELADQSLNQGLQELTSWLAAEPRPLGEALPDELRETLARLAAQPFTPSRELLLSLLDRPAVRSLIRELLVDTLISFGQRLRNPVVETRLGRGISGIGKLAKGRAGGVRSLAGGLVGAVSSEVERQLESRAAEFADNALTQVLHKLADYLCSPSRSAEQAALRRALLEGLWELSGSQLASELSQTDHKLSLQLLRESLGAWLARPNAEIELKQALTNYLEQADFGSLDEFLRLLGCRDSLRSQAIDESERQLRALMATESFSDWLQKLLS